MNGRFEQVIPSAIKDIKNSWGGKSDAKGPSPESYLEKIPGILQESYGPYMRHGQDAYPELSQTYGSMGNHPDEYIKNIMDKFSSSPEYQQKLNDMLGVGQNAASAGGLTGYSGSQAHLADMLSNNDMQQWLKNVSDIQGQGIQGKQHFYDTGFNAAQGYSGDLANMMQTSAGLSSNRARNSNQNKSDEMSALLQALGLGAGVGASYLGNKKSIIDGSEYLSEKPRSGISLTGRSPTSHLSLYGSSPTDRFSFSGESPESNAPSYFGRNPYGKFPSINPMYGW